MIDDSQNRCSEWRSGGGPLLCWLPACCSLQASFILTNPHHHVNEVHCLTQYLASSSLGRGPTLEPQWSRTHLSSALTCSASHSPSAMWCLTRPCSFSAPYIRSVNHSLRALKRLQGKHNKVP